MPGSIYRRRKIDGSWSKWYAVIDYSPTPDGRRRQVTTSHATRRAAQLWLDDVAARQRAREMFSGPTLSEFVDEWLSSKQALRPATRVSYAGHIRRHLKPHLGDLEVARISRADVLEAFTRIRLKAEERDAPLSARSLGGIKATLNAALNDAVRQGLLASNPVKGVEFPTTPPRDLSQLWDLEQLKTFLASVEDDWIHPIVVVLVMRGVRRGEALGLRWCDVDFSRQELHVRQQLISVGGAVMTGPPKSAAGRRSIAMDPLSERVLSRLQGTQRSSALQYNWEITPTTLVFTSPQGKILDPLSVSRHFGQLVAQSGLPHMRLHDLRHLSATLGLQSGESLKEVQSRLGHSSLAITADVYTEVSSPLAARSAQRLAQEVLNNA